MKSKFIKLFSGPLLCILMGYVVGVLCASPMVGLIAGSGLMIAGSFPKEVGSLFMATPDTSALGAYAGAHEMALFKTLQSKLTILTDLMMLPGIKNTLRLTKLTVKDGVRGYREDFDSSDDDLSYSGQDLSTTLLKRDIKINPLKYRPTWMAAKMKPGVNPGDIPFAQFVNEAIMLQVASEIQRGSYLAVKGDESTLLKSFDGIGTLISKAIAAETAVAGSGIVPVATGAITNTNAVAAFESMVSAMPSDFVKNGFEVKASIDSARKYNKDYRERYGKYADKDDMNRTIIEDTAGVVTIKPCDWMGTSGRLIATPYENALVGVDGIGDQDKIITDVELEIIKYRILFALGFQFRDLKALRVNDQA